MAPKARIRSRVIEGSVWILDEVDDVKIEVGTADSVTVYTLVEDWGAEGTSFYAQHGVSFLLDVTTETTRKRVLFDAGRCAQPILQNMDLLKLDPSTIDMICISHSHLDHTGGLVEMLKAMKKTCIPVVAHPDIFKVKLLTDPYLRNIGLLEANTKEKVEEYGGRWVLVRNPMKLMEGVVTTGEIPLDKRVSFEKKTTLNSYMIEDGALVKDPLFDEISLAVKTRKGLVVISGCSHAGIVSIAKRSIEITHSKNLRAVIGGFHLCDFKEERTKQIMKSLKELKAEKIYAGHCTGFEAECMFLNEFGEDLEKLHAGKIMQF